MPRAGLTAEAVLSAAALSAVLVVLVVLVVPVVLAMVDGRGPSAPALAAVAERAGVTAFVAGLRVIHRARASTGPELLSAPASRMPG